MLTEWLRLAVSSDFSELPAVGTELTAVGVQSSLAMAVFYQSHLLKLL